MSKITLDAELCGKLRGLAEPVELCDDSGRVLGRFVPVIDMSEWEWVGPEVSEEELDRRERSDRWYTTEEVLEHLRRLERGECSGSGGSSEPLTS